MNPGIPPSDRSRHSNLNLLGAKLFGVLLTISAMACPAFGACTPGPAPSVTICSPTSGATVASPVLVSAAGSSSTPITKTLVYIDSVLQFQTNTSTVNNSFAVAAGKHNLTVQFFNGAWVLKNEPFTVSSGSAVSVTISPTSATVAVSGKQQFTATVTGTTTTAVNWSVDAVSGGSATVGTVSTTGLYTAPAASGTHTVKATSQASATASASAAVTVGTAPPVTGDITVNFNARSGGIAIPAGLFGSQMGNLSSVPLMQELVDAGISGTRLYANVQSVFGSQTPNWTLIDPTFDKLKLAGLRPILMIAFTPTWLQPTPNPCSELPAANNAHPYNSAPTNNASYASIAAQYVAHLDSKYPGLVQYYEIWNEADETNQFCGLHAGDTKQVQLRLNEYKALYVAMAAAMKAQATKDGTSIKVGGPALGNYSGSNFWISQLVQAANVGTTKLADFVSYHQYPAGADVSHTMTFTGAGGTASLYSRTVSPTTGLAAIYKSIAAAAGSNVPVLLDEYNDDWDFFNDCCKNKPTYSAVWNALVFTTIMNTAYSGVPPLQHISYYSASNQPFCMLGYTGDGLYGCGATAQLPYPQFRLFELLASHNFLDLQAGGGHLALAASQTAALTTAGLVATAFYTPGGADSVVLVNPTATAVSNKVIVMQNHGFTVPTATQYLLNGTTYSATHPVAGVALPLTASGSSVKTTVTIPPYSVLAIKME